LIGKRIVRLNIKEDTWNKVAGDLPGENDDKRLRALLSRYSKLLEENKKTTIKQKMAVSKVKELLIKIEDTQATLKEAQTEKSGIEKELRSLRQREKAQREEIEELRANPVTVEKVVFKENEQVVSDLKEKRDMLQKKLWENEKELRGLEQELDSFRKQAQEEDENRLAKYALLITLKPNDESSDFTFSASSISLGEFNKLLRSKGEFCKFMRIRSPSLVWRLWDRGSSPDDEIFITSRDLIKVSKERTLKQVTIPLFQLKTLESFEEKYQGAEEMLSTLRIKFKELEEAHTDITQESEDLGKEIASLREENDRLKAAPPKIEYQDSKDTKVLIQTLKKENERLQMQIIELGAISTGSMQQKSTKPSSFPKPEVQKGPPSDRETFIKKGDRFQVTIEGLGRTGDGFVKIRNYVIFIPDTKIGEDLEVEVTRTTRKCGFAKPLR